MITTPFKSVLYQLARKVGLDPERNLQPNIADALAGYINDQAQEAWDEYAWPEICPIEERVFRPEYSADETYNKGREVWDPETAAYYESLADGNQGNPVTDTEHWAQTTTLERAVLLDQPGKTPIGDVLEAWIDNPSRTTSPRSIEYWISNSGIQFGPKAPNVVYIQYRLRAPEWTATPWKTTLTYAAGEVRYFATTGECYKATAATTTGESPATTPAKWELQPMLAIFAPYVVLAAFADTLDEDGQTDKALGVRNVASGRLSSAMDRINVQQRQTAHFSVRQP
ncbi:MAG: hypothetical protein ACFUZC_04965 [Chthoniobacteraceae bacterium]